MSGEPERRLLEARNGDTADASGECFPWRRDRALAASVGVRLRKFQCQCV